MNIEKTARELDAQNYSFTSSDEWSLINRYPEDWATLAESWDRLAVDRYMKSGDTYRQRRFCKYAVDASRATVVELDDFGFYQSRAINSYAGGQRREFAPVEPDIRKNRIVREIIQTCLHAILDCDPDLPKKWNVFVHQIRINCSRSAVGQPTPEGLHRDGHDFISMHLIDRVGVEGGTSRICSIDGRPLMTVTLRHRMDGFLVDDRALLHGVSQITPSTADAGHRDMLIIDYNRDE